jgi:hypothetical protein
MKIILQESNLIEFKRKLTDALEKEAIAFLNYDEEEFFQGYSVPQNKGGNTSKIKIGGQIAHPCISQ